MADHFFLAIKAEATLRGELHFRHAILSLVAFCFKIYIMSEFGCSRAGVDKMESSLDPRDRRPVPEQLMSQVSGYFHAFCVILSSKT